MGIVLGSLSRIRPPILLLILGLGFMAVCKKQAAPRPPVAPSDQPAVPAALQAANRSYLEGQYREAILRYEDLLKDGGERSEEVLYRLSISYILADDDNAYSERAIALLQELSSKLSPQDSRTPHVKAVLVLSQEVHHLNQDLKSKDQQIEAIKTQLEKLKEIDVERRNN